MSIFNRLDGVPGTTAVPPTGGARFGPLPWTNIRKLLTPGMSVVVPAVATSAIPLATGSVPPTLVLMLPLATPEHMSKEPAQSAKLIIIDGVPALNWLGAGNNPCVNCSKLTGPATNDADTAAYNT